jgi:uncharacterized protein (DUF1501 family)
MPMMYINRRQFLQLGLMAAGAAAVGALVPGLPGGDGQAAAAGDVSAADRFLVVIDMAGGNDGMSMVPPRGAAYGRYHDLRPRVALPESAALPLTAALGLHPDLARLHARYTAGDGVAFLAGVGIATPDLSHFEMLRRWWAGDHTSLIGNRTGLLGRLCDAVATRDDLLAAPAVGVSLGYGPTPALISETASTLSVNPYDSGGFPVFWDTEVDAVWKAAWAAMNADAESAAEPYRSARRGGAYAMLFADGVMAELSPAADGYPPDSDFGYQLSLAARLLAGGRGVRVVHIPMNGDFDTHDDHVSRYAAMMTRLDTCLEAFRLDLEQRGIADRVLVATTSEFGRRPADNESNGLDHGAASVTFLAGAPVNTGVFGEYPAFGSDTDLDADGNLRPTVDMWELYAILATWMGVPPAELNLAGASPVPGVLKA